MDNYNTRIYIEPFGPMPKAIFYLFLISLPFEALLISGGLLGFTASDSAWSLSRFTGLVLIVALLFSRRRIHCIKVPAVWYFLIYVFLYLLAAVYTSVSSNYLLSSQLLVIPWLILMFIVCCEFFLDSSLRVNALKALMVAISLCALLQLGDLAFNRSIPMVFGESEVRVGAFGGNANFVGAQYAVGFMIAILFLVGILPSGRGFKITSLLGSVVCTLGLIQTGSRSSAICLVIALLALLFNQQPSSKRKLIWLASVLSIGILVVLVIGNKGFLSRFQDTLNYGDTSKRTDIYQASFRVFLASPMLGFPPGLNTVLVGYVMDSIRAVDTHNTLLSVLTASGLIAFIPFFLGILMSLIQAFRARYGPDGIASLALCLLAVAFCQTASWQTEKLFWVLLAYGATSVVSK
jgi:O-antigen ligase